MYFSVLILPNPLVTCIIVDPWPTHWLLWHLIFPLFLSTFWSSLLPSSFCWLIFIYFWMLIFLRSQSLSILNSQAAHPPWAILFFLIVSVSFSALMTNKCTHQTPSFRVLYASAHMVSSKGPFYDTSKLRMSNNMVILPKLGSLSMFLTSVSGILLHQVVHLIKLEMSLAAPYSGYLPPRITPPFSTHKKLFSVIIMKWNE